MKIAVLGTGTMGCLFGGLLCEGGHDVILPYHREEQAEAVRRKRLKVTT